MKFKSQSRHRPRSVSLAWNATSDSLPPKQLVSQPNTIGVDDITFTIVGDFLDLAIEEVSFDLGAILLSGFPASP